MSQAVTYTIDPAHSTAGFKVRHLMVSNVRGEFSGVFSYITKNWRGKPLESHEVIVNLIGNTATKTGLRIRTGLDSQIYPTGIEVPDEVMEGLNMERSEFHGEWNYRILPRPT